MYEYECMNVCIFEFVSKNCAMTLDWVLKKIFFYSHSAFKVHNQLHINSTLDNNNNNNIIYFSIECIRIPETENEVGLKFHMNSS